MSVSGVFNYIGPMSERPRYYANDNSRDRLVLDPERMPVEDARRMADPPRLDREGFTLVPHVSQVADFKDRESVARIHPAEIAELLRRLSGADEVVVTSPGVLRFGEKDRQSGQLDNSRPARFVHVDINDATAAAFTARSCPPGKAFRRAAHYNVWRVISPPPQDVPLAVCDARSVADQDLVEADAVFDTPGKPEWSFVGLVVRHNPAHRWVYYSGMSRDEALVFKTNDTDPHAPHSVPHSAFDDATAPPDALPRASIEMRGIAYWY